MDQGDVEGLADQLHRDAGGTDYEPASLAAICRTHRIRVERSRNVIGGGAQCVLRGQTRIYLRHQLPEGEARFFLAHELIEWALEREGYRGPDVERWANYGAAALLAPRRLYARAIGYGLSIAELAQEFIVSQTLAVLRMSEIMGDPRAVVCPHRVYVAGEGHFPEAERMRALTRGPERPGVRRAKLTDARKRTLLEFEAA